MKPDRMNEDFFEIIKLMHKMAYKDMRVGQMFSNIFSRLMQNDVDPFYMENEDFLTAFKEIYNLDDKKE